MQYDKVLECDKTEHLDKAFLALEGGDWRHAMTIIGMREKMTRAAHMPMGENGGLHCVILL